MRVGLGGVIMASILFAACAQAAPATPIVINATTAPAPFASPVPSIETHTISAKLVLDGPLRHYVVLEDGSCSGSSSEGFGDISASTQVTIKDEGGKFLASSQLGIGSVSEGDCIFLFNFADLTDAKVFTINIGRRGDLPYSKQLMIKLNWQIERFL